jgi:hypothetical protein
VHFGPRRRESRKTRKEGVKEKKRKEKKRTALKGKELWEL